MKNYFLFIFLLLSLNSFTQNYGEWELSEEISDGEELYRMGILKKDSFSLTVVENYVDISFMLKDDILTDEIVKVLFDFEFDMGSCLFITYGVPSEDRKYLIFSEELTNEKYFNYLKISKKLKITIIYGENKNKRYLFDIDGMGHICDYVFKKI
jgi:hypothetical protein